MSTIDLQHLATIFAMVLLVFIVCTTLGVRRFLAIKRGAFPKNYFKLLRSETAFVPPENVEQASRNFINLFEIPVIFYVFVMVLIWTQKTDTTSLFLCWIFVGSRYTHSLVHLTSNKVNWRFLSYAVGLGALFIGWLRLAVFILN